MAGYGRRLRESSEEPAFACQRTSAGLASTFPAASVARTANVCHPGCTPQKLEGESHELYGAASRLQAYEAGSSALNENTAASLSGNRGDTWVSGGMSSGGAVDALSPDGDGVEGVDDAPPSDDSDLCRCAGEEPVVGECVRASQAGGFGAREVLVAGAPGEDDTG